MSDSYQALYAWLFLHSPVGSVVVTDDLPLSVELPAMSHNSVLFSNGSRGNAGSRELLERFLLAGRLENAPETRVQAELLQAHSGQMYSKPTTYAYYLFQAAPMSISGSGISALYRDMDPVAELRRFRVDYLWTHPDESPASISGWVWRCELRTADGTLWSLHPST